jgi:hypothetical protein
VLAVIVTAVPPSLRSEGEAVAEVAPLGVLFRVSCEAVTPPLTAITAVSEGGVKGTPPIQRATASVRRNRKTKIKRGMSLTNKIKIFLV